MGSRRLLFRPTQWVKNVVVFAAPAAGLKLFTAWMNHNDSDAVNTLDMYYTDEDGRSFVRHHLIDFGTIFGAGANDAHGRRVGHEYYIEFKPALKAAATLGIWDRPWRHLNYEEYPSVGRFAAGG